MLEVLSRDGIFMRNREEVLKSRSITFTLGHRGLSIYILFINSGELVFCVRTK